MYFALAIFASLLGLLVTGAAIFTAVSFYSSRRRTGGDGVSPEAKDARPPAGGTFDWFLRWTLADYAVLFLFGFGSVFLLTDLIGVAREKELYPPFHYAYLLCGTIFSFMGMLFSFVRLALVLRLTGRAAAVAHDAHKPDEANQAE